jgi:hypothetical protein
VIIGIVIQTEDIETIFTFQRPMLIAETGAEGEARAPWLQEISENVAVALDQAMP